MIPYLRKKWGISIDAHSEYVPYEDIVKFETINSEKGVFLPQYQVLSPFNVKVSLDFDFLYSLDYEVNIVLDKDKKAIGVDCKSSIYCAKIINFDWVSINSKTISFNGDLFQTFLELGFSFKWFKEKYDTGFIN